MKRIFSCFVVSVSLLALSAGAALAQAPDNDEVGNATVITAVPFSDSVDTREATTAPDDPNCFGRGHTVWYTYTAPADQSLIADTFGSDYDTTLSVYTGSTTDLEQIACNDDAGFQLQSAVGFDAEEGTTYYFMVGAFGGGPGGDLVFNLDEGEFEPAQMEITVDGAGRFTSSGAAAISGTATCNEGDVAFIDVELTQRVGRFLIRGFGGTFLECDGSAQPWTIEVSPDTGLFRGGSAEVNVFAESCGLIDCAFDFETATVRLKRR